MKLNAIANRTFWLMLGWLVVVMPAGGFYDPSLGRWLNRDPSGEKDGPNVHAFIGNQPIHLYDPFGLAAQGVPVPPQWPKFDPTKTWPGDNCTTYACNRRGIGPTQPWGNGPKCANTCPALLAASKKHLGMVDGGAPCPEGFHPVFLVRGTDSNGNPDYHFYRQDDDGMWSSKHGRTGPVDRLDGSRRPISDPSDPSVNHRYPGGSNYTEPCGFLCAPH